MLKADMTICDVRRHYKVELAKEWRWIQVPVASVGEGETVRCSHCHGKVRVPRKRVGHVPQDHVEHSLREDSENCQGSDKFKGTHSMSSRPVN